MDKELTIIAEPEELIAWADTFDILLNPSIEDAAILLNYMEGHDYAIGIDSEGKMYRQDVSEENGEVEPYQIDDVIDTTFKYVCHNWIQLQTMTHRKRNVLYKVIVTWQDNPRKRTEKHRRLSIYEYIKDTISL